MNILPRRILKTRLVLLGVTLGIVALAFGVHTLIR
jgi:hypothetical protein